MPWLSEVKKWRTRICFTITVLRILLKKLHGKGSFVLVMAYTETAGIPGITVAGASPELMAYTPPLDAELVHAGKIITLDNMAMTSEAIPTPGLITRAAITLSDFREFYVDAGNLIPPFIPHYRVGNGPGADIRTGKAVPWAKQIMENARKVGKEIAEQSEYIVIGETIPAGTTTALGVLMAMGMDINNYTSSSMQKNPQSLKTSVVMEGLKKAGISGPCDPLKAIEAVGDPMMAATIGLVQGAKGVPVILAGGTQMADGGGITFKDVRPGRARPRSVDDQVGRRGQLIQPVRHT